MRQIPMRFIETTAKNTLGVGLIKFKWSLEYRTKDIKFWIDRYTVEQGPSLKEQQR